MLGDSFTLRTLIQSSDSDSGLSFKEGETFFSLTFNLCNMDILTSFALAHHMHTGEWPKDGIHTLPGNTDYRYKRISPSRYRSTEIPSVGERIRYDFCVWHIRPEKDVLFRVELV